MKNLFQLRFPKGWAWRIKNGGQFSKIISAAEEHMLSESIALASACGTIRDPNRALDPEALATDVGMELFTSGTIEDYRKRLESYVFTPYRTGSDTDLQKVLIDAGFTDAVVVKNNNAQDLRHLTNTATAMWCNGSNAFCGSNTGYAGSTGYEVLVNGPLKNVFGNNVGYNIGTDPDYWGYVDIVCGGATFAPNGDIETITELEVAKNFEESFKRLILRTKPTHDWIILGVSFVDPTIIAQTGDPTIPTIAQTGETTIPIIAQTGN